jgi:serine/threonine protein kinase
LHLNGVVKRLLLFFISISLFGFTARAQTIIRIKNGQRTITYRIVKPIGTGGMGTVYKVIAEGRNYPEAIKLFKKSIQDSITSSNIESYQTMERIFKSDPTAEEYLTKVSVAEASVDFGPPETIVIMPFLEQSGMQTFPDIRAVKSEEALEAKVQDLHDIWRSGVRAILKLHQHGLAHNDVKLSNMLRNSEHYILGDFDTITASNKTTRGGSAAYMPPDFAIHSGASLEGDMFGLAMGIAEQMTGESFHAFKDWEDIRDTAGALERVQQLNRELHKNMDPIYEIFPSHMTQTKQVLESLVMFINASLQFSRAAREVELLGLLQNPRFETSMKADLAPVEALVNHAVEARTMGRVITPLRRAGSCEKVL